MIGMIVRIANAHNYFLSGSLTTNFLRLMLTGKKATPPAEIFDFLSPSKIIIQYICLSISLTLTQIALTMSAGSSEQLQFFLNKCKIFQGMGKIYP
jgi:hypothetical protein